jgi:hypothetical protein
VKPSLLAKLTVNQNSKKQANIFRNITGGRPRYIVAREHGVSSALAAAQLEFKVGHIEEATQLDRRMPEKTNHVLTDYCTAQLI